jgi:hypothetical protein
LAGLMSFMITSCCTRDRALQKWACPGVVVLPCQQGGAALCNFNFRNQKWRHQVELCKQNYTTLGSLE